MQIYISIYQLCDDFMTDDTMKMTSRQRILEIIRRHQKITTSGINIYLQMTPANIRHHLSSLVSDGLVEINETRKKERGRPEKVYSPSKSLSDDGLEQLVVALLYDIRQNSEGKKIPLSLKKVAEDWAEQQGSMQFRLLPKRLSHCIELLNELKYSAQWEAGREGPIVRLNNCPYARIIRIFPELCEMDKVLLDNLVGFSFTQKSKLEKDEKGLKHCIFMGHQE